MRMKNQMQEATAACRIYCIIAADQRSAVVFRRGPSKQVQVLRWWFDRDRLEPGQWINGRIYERRCDVSPDGNLLLAFVATWKGPLQSWTAISRTPYLTALALWPKGDAWGGGGVFDMPRAIGLNYHSIPPVMSPSLPRAKWHPLGPEPTAASLIGGYAVDRCAEWAGHGEDNPIEGHRLARNGWRVVAAGEHGTYRQDARYAWEMTVPEVMARDCPMDDGLVLQRVLRAIGERDGPWYVEDFELRQPDGTLLRLLSDCSWADWCGGDLLFALDGRLYRLPQTQCRKHCCRSA